LVTSTSRCSTRGPPSPPGDRYGQAVEHLRGIALGEVDYDFAESRAAHAQRESR
jgi:hypothetical protein